MTQSSNKISRRDWFRLRIPKQNTMLCDSATGSPNSSLQPIEHPPNHDGLDVSVLPPMREAILAIDEVEMLFADVEEFGSDVQLMQRSTASRRATASAANVTGQLAAAKDALLTAQVAKLQIRYRWKNTLWIDTLETKDQGFRLVRIAHQQLK